MAMLEIKNVHKAFDGQDVLKGISLSVEKGDVVAILGKSGSGKTTLLRCINFLETADDGELVFDGETVSPSATLPASGRRRPLYSRTTICSGIRQPCKTSPRG